MGSVCRENGGTEVTVDQLQPLHVPGGSGRERERERERERGRNGNRKRGEKNWIAGTCALVVKQTGHSLVLRLTISPVDWFTSLHSILSMVMCLVFSLQHF